MQGNFFLQLNMKPAYRRQTLNQSNKYLSFRGKNMQGRFSSSAIMNSAYCRQSGYHRYNA